MYPVDLFSAVTEKGRYLISYLNDGGTHELFIEAKTPGEAMLKVQNKLGSICDVTFVERS